MDVPGYRKHGPEIYQRHLLTSEYPQEDEMNLTDQCPSYLLEGADSIKSSLFQEKSDKGNLKDFRNVSESKNDSAEQPPIATFEEWTKQKLEQEKKKIQTVNAVNGAENGGEHVIQQQPSISDKKTNSVTSTPDGQKKEEAPRSSSLIDVLPIGASKRNYGSKECGAKIIAANDESENRGAILNDKEKDEYMRNPCKAEEKFLIIELCETIQPTAVELANFELFSSSVKEFRILASSRYPTVEWTNLGEFVAQDTREVQAFNVPEHNVYAKFLRLELISHYEKEHYCTLSAFRVYGMSISDEIDLVEAETSPSFHQIPAPEEVKGVPEENVVEVTQMEPDVEEVTQMEPVVEREVPQGVTVSTDDITEEPTVIQHQSQVNTHHISSWRIRDCQKCTTRQQSAIIWLCYVFSPSICSESREKTRSRTVFIRSPGQIKFLKSVLKPLPMCPKGSVPQMSDSNQNIKRGDQYKVETNFEGINDSKNQQKIVIPKERPPSIPLPAGPTSHKESVFLKLNKRLAALEVNISLSSEYLSELSRRYVAQIEDSKKEQEKHVKIMEEKIEKQSKVLKKQFLDLLHPVKEDVKNLRKMVERMLSLTSTVPAWNGENNGNDKRTDVHDLAIRTCLSSDKNCNGDDFEDVYLDQSDGLWTTNQLLVILAAMQLSTITVIFAILYFWRRESPPKERVVLISSDFDVREIIKEEIKKEICEKEPDKNQVQKSPDLMDVQVDIQLQRDAAEVQVLLEEIKVEGLKAFGAFSDYNPQKTRERIQQVSFDDGTEASVNRPVLDYLFENDIVLTVPQAKNILDDLRNPKGTERKPRQAQPGESYLWKNKRVSYTFKINDSKWQNLIRSALQHMEEQTCMRFYENGTDADQLQYTRAGGCWSNVGRVGGKQTVSIGYGCEALGIVAHETLHALGLWHEQARYDRDDYIKIDFSYIFPGTQYNFVKRTPQNSENLGQRYDLGSVMHYGAKAFSTDYTRNTIITNDENYQYTIGQRVGISFKDARMINIRYCSDVCEEQLECKNGGYTDPNDCSKCRCPSGLGGKYCDRVAYSPTSACNGGERRAASQWQTLTSPVITQGMNCFWKITASSGESVELAFTQSSFPCTDACSSFVELKHLADKSTSGARICCKPPKATIITEDDFALLWLRGDPDIINGYTGFEVRFRSVPTTQTTSIVPTTTPTPTTTTTGYGAAEWSSWGDWSECSVKCGGCGERVRVRACYGGNARCEGSSSESDVCGQDPCEIPNKTTRCSGRLVMPCDLLDQLDFGTTHNTDPLSGNPKLELLQTKKNAKTLRRIRREALERENTERGRRFVDGNKQMAGGNFCEKKFSYNCPTSLLTINIDRKSNKDTIGNDSRRCCPGWYSNQGRCIKG